MLIFLLYGILVSGAHRIYKTAYQHYNHWYTYSVQIAYFISLYSYLVMANGEDKPTDELPNSLPESEGKHNHHVWCVAEEPVHLPYSLHKDPILSIHSVASDDGKFMFINLVAVAVCCALRLRCACTCTSMQYQGMPVYVVSILFATTWLKRREHNLSWWCGSLRRFTR